MDLDDTGLKNHFSVDDFSRLVYDDILVPCLRAKKMLTKVLVDDCELWSHLTSIEDLYLMRKGDAMSNFVDVLFARVSVFSIIPTLSISNIPLDGHQPTLDRFPFPE